jgi:hypothetical protein
MESVGLPKGLIRYASEDEIEKNTFKFTARMKGYSSAAYTSRYFWFLFFFTNRVEVLVLRLPGQLFQHKGENISNMFYV